MITQKMLKEKFHYDPESGVFTRLVSGANNKVKVGDIAGSPNLGYIRIWMDGRHYMAHRLAFLYMTGAFPEEQVDHINHIRNDNRWANLRAVTRLENSRNLKRPTRNTSGHIGVSWVEPRKKWTVNIRINGKLKHLGYFESLEDAVAARKVASREHGFHENHGQVCGQR